MGTLYSLIVFLLVGVIAGYLAGNITSGKSFGWKKNLLLGIAGSFLGGFIFWLLGFSSHSFFASLITATAGSLLVIYLFKRLS